MAVRGRRYIQLDHDLRSKPQLRQLMIELDLDLRTVLGALALFWTWVDIHGKGGRVTFASRSVTDESCMTQGMCHALERVGWARWEDETTLIVPGSRLFFGGGTRERALAADRAKRYRQRQRDAKGPRHVTSGVNKKNLKNAGVRTHVREGQPSVSPAAPRPNGDGSSPATPGLPAWAAKIEQRYGLRPQRGESMPAYLDRLRVAVPRRRED